MTSDILAALLRFNLVLALGVIVVLALRFPTRRLFGPEIAYGLWGVPPVAALASILPARVDDAAPEIHALAAALADVSLAGLLAWGTGVALAITGLAHAQARFNRAAAQGRAGPAVVGVIAPRVLMPADDGTYSVEERALIRAHEREHVARCDPRAGALAAVLQAVCWFNPLVHLGTHLMRLDQELACDAAVLRRRPRDRALYARTLLKTQLAAQPLPFGCYWPSRGQHPLDVRIGALRTAPRLDGLMGSCLVSLSILSAAFAAWHFQPPAPRPGPLVELWERHQRQPVTSVMLVSLPPDTRPAAARP